MADSRRALAGLAATSVALASFWSSCVEGGPIEGQRTFLWHQGDASESALPADRANPFRGRVAAGRGRILGAGFSIIDDPSATRHYEGDPNLPDVAFGGFLPVDLLDPRIEALRFPPPSVLLNIEGLPLSAFFPDSFGGDYSGGVSCVDPFDDDFEGFIAGFRTAPSGSQCIRGSTDIATGTLYTAPSIVRTTGGMGEQPFRPAPDFGVTGRVLLENSGTAEAPVFERVPGSLQVEAPPGTARGLFYPSRGSMAGASMSYERNVDPTSGRPLVARIGSEGVGTCTGAGELATNLATGVDYSTSFASHPLSMTIGAPTAGPRGIASYRGGIGTDPLCLRPGGRPGLPNAFPLDESLGLFGTNALDNHHANLGVFASLCDATLARDPTPFAGGVNTDTRSGPFGGALDPSACIWNLFSSPRLLNIQLVPVPFAELLTTTLAGEQSGGGAAPQSFLSLTQIRQKAVDSDVTAPLVSLSRLPNPATDPILDRNGDGMINADGCDGVTTTALDILDPGATAGERILGCDLGGFDGFDSRTSSFGASTTPQTLDSTLTNEQRAQIGCGPFWGTRCDSSVADAVYTATGGIDFLNGEASAMFEATPDTTDTTTVTGTAPQPGTVGFMGAPVCFRRNGAGQLQRMPGCRGVASYEILRDATGPVAINVVFEDGYLPELDGCVIGHRVRPVGRAPIPVAASYESAGAATELNDQLELCSTARVRRLVPEFAWGGFSNGLPGPQGPNPDCAGQPGGGAFIGYDFSLCNANDVTLEEMPLIHPLASCEGSDVWFQTRADAGLGGCDFFIYRDLVEEFLDGTAQLFRSELSAFSWNLTTFLTATSCDASTPDAAGVTHDPPFAAGNVFTVEQALRADPECYDFENPFDPDRCSFAAPQLCKNVKAFLGFAPPIAGDGSTPDADGDGLAADGDGSGVAGDRPCRTRETTGCDDNCVDLVNREQVNSNGLDPNAADADPFGNLCDPDLDDDGDVDGDDLDLQLTCFRDPFAASILPRCAHADLVGASRDDDADPDAVSVDGFDRLQLLRWLRDPNSEPGRAPAN